MLRLIEDCTLYYRYFVTGKLTELWSNSGRCMHQMNVKKVTKTPLICGQPTEESHPHLVRKGEVSTLRIKLSKCNLVNICSIHFSWSPAFKEKNL